MNLTMSEAARLDVERDPGDGLFFFVCSLPSERAVVVAARVAKADADELVRRAKRFSQRWCVRVGRVRDGQAVTL